MNFSDAIKDQLADGILDKLSAAIGVSEEKLKAAIGVAVPSLLAALSKLASSSPGAEALIRTLRQFDGAAVDRLRTDLTRDDGGKVRDQGGDVLGSLFGGDLAALVNVLSKFSDVGAVALKSLLSYLAPLVLGMIAEQMKGKSLTPAGLGEFFSEQRPNIEAALPAGFALPAPSSLPTTVSKAGGKTSSNWLLPLAALVALGAAAWYFMGDQQEEEPGGMAPPVIPAAAPVVEPAATPEPTPAEPAPPVDPNAPEPTGAEVNKSLEEILAAATQALSSVKDAGTAEAAAPALKDLIARLDAVKPVFRRLADYGKAMVVKGMIKKLEPFKAQVAETLARPGVEAKLKDVLDALVAKLSSFIVTVSSVPTS